MKLEHVKITSIIITSIVIIIGVIIYIQKILKEEPEDNQVINNQPNNNQNNFVQRSNSSMSTPSSVNSVKQNCIGRWSTCGSNCKKTYNVIVPESNGGNTCSNNNGETMECTSGEGDCPFHSCNLSSIQMPSDTTTDCPENGVLSHDGTCSFKCSDDYVSGGYDHISCFDGELNYDSNFSCTAHFVPPSNDGFISDCRGYWSECEDNCSRHWVVTHHRTVDQEDPTNPEKNGIHCYDYEETGDQPLYNGDWMYCVDGTGKVESDCESDCKDHCPDIKCLGYICSNGDEVNQNHAKHNESRGGDPERNCCNNSPSPQSSESLWYKGDVEKHANNNSKSCNEICADLGKTCENDTSKWGPTISSGHNPTPNELNNKRSELMTELNNSGINDIHCDYPKENGVPPLMIKYKDSNKKIYNVCSIPEIGPNGNIGSLCSRTGKQGLPGYGQDQTLQLNSSLKITPEKNKTEWNTLCKCKN